MSLVIVNPSPRAKAPAKRTTATIRPKAAKGAKMAKRHRTPAQKAATRKMLAANRRHRNPAPRRASAKRRVYHRNPAPAARHYRRRRNPSTAGTGGSMFKELMSKDGLMQVAAVAVTPTLTELLVSTVMPSATGYTRVAVKAGLGLGLAWAVSKFVSKRVGMIASLVVAGTAAAELYHAYSGSGTTSTPATTSGYLGAYGARPAGTSHKTMKGYGHPQAEPGVIYLS